MKVKSVKFNWCQKGSVMDRDGAGDDWERATVGVLGVTKIVENEPNDGLQQWNYLVFTQDEESCRIFNPNFVEYEPTNK